MTNIDVNRTVMTMPFGHIDQKSGDGPVSLTFECAGTDCALVQVAPGTGQTYRIWQPRTEKDGATRLAAIRAVLVK